MGGVSDAARLWSPLSAALILLRGAAGLHPDLRLSVVAQVRINEKKKKKPSLWHLLHMMRAVMRSARTPAARAGAGVQVIRGVEERTEEEDGRLVVSVR